MGLDTRGKKGDILVEFKEHDVICVWKRAKF